MGWEFAALWVDDLDAPWKWVWRRVADDGAVVEESSPFQHLDLCLEDARRRGFDDDTQGPAT